MADPPARCPRCGAPLDGEAGTLCPACLLKAAIEPEPGGGTGSIAAGETRLTSDPRSDDGETRLTPAGSLRPAPTGPRGMPSAIGPYRLVRVLGEGGMGVVYLAEQTEPIRRTVALKVIKLGMDTRDVVARFESERQALALMDHPNIARVIDAGATPDGRPFFVMEHVDGVPITDYCDAHRLSTRARLALVATICGAIQHAHQKGVIHRDLKPSNVLVAEQDGTPTPKIIDFGIAKATQQPLTERTMFTEQGQFIGTPEYMSPEQTGVGGVNVDATTDIYSLGVLLYELLVGALPFEPAALRKAGYAEMQRIIREDEPPKPSTRISGLGATATDVANRRHTDIGALRRQLSGDLDWITLKAIEKDRTRRYASASEFAADITRYLNDEPVLASPPSAAYRAQKFVRRHRFAVAAASLMALTLVAGVIVSTWMYLNAEQQRHEADAQRARADAGKDEADRQRADAMSQRAKADANAARAEEQRIQADEQRAEADRQRTDAVAQSYVSGLTTVAMSLEQLDGGGDPSLEVLRLRDAPLGLRNWEWRFLAAKVDSVDHQLLAPAGARGPLAFSSDGHVYWTTDRILVAWDLATSQRTVFRSEEDPIVAVDPSGQFILRIHAGREARVLSTAAAPTAPVASLPASDRPIVAAAFSPRGSRLATATADGAIRVWRPESAESISETTGVTGRPTTIQFAPDDGSLLAVTATSAFLVPLEPTAPARPLIGWKDGSVARFAADGQSLWFGDKEGKLHHVDVASGSEIGVLTGFASQVTALAISRDGRWLVTGTDSGLIRLWDIAAQAPVSVIGSTSEGGSTLEFSPGDRYLVAGTKQAEVVFWDLTRIRLAHGVALGAAKGAPIALSPDGRWAATASESRITRWDLDSRPLASIEYLSNPRIGSMKALALLVDGRLAVGTDSGGVWLWMDPARDPVELDAGLDGPVSSVAFSVDGRRLAAGGGKNDVRAWEAATGRVCFRTRLGTVNTMGNIIRFSGGQEVAVTFDASGEKLITRHQGGIVDFVGGLGEVFTETEIWDILSGTRRSGERYGLLDSVAFTPDGTRSVATRDPNPLLKSGRIEIRRPADDSLLGSSDVRLGGLRGVAASPDGSRLAAVDEAGAIHVLDAQRGRLLLSVTGRSELPAGVCFSPDGSRVTVAYRDGVVQVLDTRTPFSVDLSVSAALDPLWGSAQPDAQIATDPQLTPSERMQAAARIAQTRDRDPAETLNARSWALIAKRGRPAAEYRQAARLAQQALDLVPWSPEYVGSIGVAQYWAGDYPAALATLTRSVDRWSATGATWKPNTSNSFSFANSRMVVGDPLLGANLASAPIVRATRAMCLLKFGRTAEARADVEQVRLAARKSKPDTRVTGVLKEADALVVAAEMSTERDPAAVRQARALVNKLFENASIFSDDVVDRVTADPGLTTAVREAALRMAKALVDDPADLNTASRNVVHGTGGTPEDYRIALRRAEKADRLAPNSAARLNTLALAQYRVGRYDDALATIAKVSALRAPLPVDVVVTVLSRLRLGQLEAARTDLQRLLTVPNPTPEVKSLIGEAKALSDSLKKD